MATVVEIVQRLIARAISLVHDLASGSSPDTHTSAAQVDDVLDAALDDDGMDATGL